MRLGGGWTMRQSGQFASMTCEMHDGVDTFIDKETASVGKHSQLLFDSTTKTYTATITVVP